MSSLGKRAKMSNEHALYDVLDIVLKNLEIKDLCNASLVDKYWYKTAKTELMKRGFESLVVELLPYDYSTPEDIRQVLVDSDKNSLRKNLQMIPKLSLIFSSDIEANFIGGPMIIGNGEVFDNHFTKLPKESDIVIVESVSVSLNETVIDAENNESKGAALFLPQSSLIEYKVCGVNLIEMKSAEEAGVNLAGHFVDELLEGVEDLKNCCLIVLHSDLEYRHVGRVIIFDAEFENFADKDVFQRFTSSFFKQLRERFKPGDFALWGGSGFINFQRSNCGEVRDVDGCWLGLRLSGKLLRSWSIEVDLDLSSAEAEKKLRDMKNLLQLRTKTVALAQAPSVFLEPTDQKLAKVATFKKVFPNIPLITLHNIQDEVPFDTNLITQDETKKSSRRKQYVSYLILSYA